MWIAPLSGVMVIFSAISSSLKIIFTFDGIKDMEDDGMDISTIFSGKDTKVFGLTVGMAMINYAKLIPC